MKTPTAILSIGYLNISLPADKAMKAMQLLSGGLKVSRNFDAVHARRKVWQIQEQVDLSLQMLRGDEVFVTEQGEAMDLSTAPTRKGLGVQRKAIAGPRR